jgi:hypothetical protein
VIAAIFGLVGVVLGGLLSGGVTYIMERRREQHETRAASRLLAEELRRAISFIHGVLRPIEGDWQSRAFAELDLDVWKQNRALLASALREDAWTDVASAFEIVESLKDERWPMDRQEEAIEALDHGLHALGRIVGSEQFWWAQRFHES